MYKILVTGDAGFIARKLSQRLTSLGHDVRGYDVINGQDLLDLDSLEKAILEVDVIYHLAAQADLTIMARDVEEGHKGVLTNVNGTHNIAYLCAKHKKWLIYASTVCVYGNQLVHPEKEDNTLPKPPELYACSKYAGEWIVKGYGSNYDMEWTILRFATIYGEGMRPALGMHIFFTQALKGEPITVHGEGIQERTLTHIDDLVDGIVAPLTHREQSKSQIFNLSTEFPVSALKMAEDIKTLTGSNSEIVFIPQRKNQTMFEDFDVSKAKELLEWSAKTSWEDGLKKTLEWIRTCVN